MSTVIDLGEHYEKKGAAKERERIVEWLGQVDRELGKQANESEDDNERNALAGAHEIVLTLTRELTKP